jgi:hypothetical protein
MKGLRGCEIVNKVKIFSRIAAVKDAGYLCWRKCIFGKYSVLCAETYLS